MMVNGLFLYRAFLVVMTTQSVFTLCLIHPFTHIHTLMTGATAQGVNLLIRRKLTIHTHSYTVGTAPGAILGLSILHKDTWTCGLEEPGIELPIF